VGLGDFIEVEVAVGDGDDGHDGAVDFEEAGGEGWEDEFGAFEDLVFVEEVF
jgi:hypothetical protein